MKKIILIFAFILGMTAISQAQSPATSQDSTINLPYVNYGEQILVLQITTQDSSIYHFWNVGQGSTTQTAQNISDFPAYVQPYILNVEVLFNVVSRANNWIFTPTGGEGLLDNYNNLYIPISNFQ